MQDHRLFLGKSLSHSLGPHHLFQDRTSQVKWPRLSLSLSFNLRSRPRHYHLFLGIEYGNAGRFEPAWPVQAWAPRVLEATNYGPVCPSTSYDFSLEEDMHMKPNSVLGRKASAFWQVNESCLYLNIYAPVGAGVDQSLPVLVWFHGGSFIAGAGSDITSEDVSVLMLRGIVVVTVNSRLGAFGFLFSDSIFSLDRTSKLHCIQTAPQSD